jgi:transcriptional regulator with XRE-family HTH domain
MSVLAAPPTLTTDDLLREHVEGLERELNAAIEPYQPPNQRDLRMDPLSRKRRVRARARWFEHLRSEIFEVARSPAWRDHDLTVELLLTLEDLRRAIDNDPDALDEGWHARMAMQLMRVVVQSMLRQIDHQMIDDPVAAAKLVIDEFRRIEAHEVARLLGVTTKSVSNWRRGRVEQIKRNPARISLIGQLVYELRGGATPRGVLMWFDRSREQLGGRTPRELIDADVAQAAPVLQSLARGGRGQLDV